jgi:hypothetical protein
VSEIERDHPCAEEPRRGFFGFLRGLLSGLPWSERAEESETVRLAAPPGGVLRIDNANGITLIRGEERDDVEIHVKKFARAESPEEAQRLARSIRVLHREDPAGALEIEIDAPGRWRRCGRADLAVHLPRGTRVEVSATNGRICLSGLRAGVRLRSSNGPVRVSDVIGDVEIQTSNAKVHTECTCGRLLARTSFGKIELCEHRGSVSAETSNGTIRCALEDLGKEGVTLVTSNGRIALELPEDCDGDVDVRVDNGVIRSARDLPDQGPPRAGRLRGTLGRGGIPIRLRASNGTISIR